MVLEVSIPCEGQTTQLNRLSPSVHWMDSTGTTTTSGRTSSGGNIVPWQLTQGQFHSFRDTTS
jgi:hypothetical protein